MSRFQSTRLSLLAGSSLALASLTAAASLGVLLTPTATYAANECTPVGEAPSVNGDAADNYSCPEAAYPGGIAYNSDGDLTVVTAPPPPVQQYQTAETNVGVGGVNLVGNGADSVTWDSTAGVLIGERGLDVTTESGDISIDAFRVYVFAPDAGSSSAIRAVSSAGGSVDVTVGYILTYDVDFQPFETGIYAEANGDGNVTITASEQVAADGGAAIHAVTENGLLTVNVSGVLGRRMEVNGGSGAGILTDAGAAAVININPATRVFGAWGVDAAAAGGSTTTVNMTGPEGSVNYENAAILTRMRGSGGGAFVLNNDGLLLEQVDFSQAGAATLNVQAKGVWITGAEESRFSAGADRVTVAEGGIIYTGPESVGSTAEPPSVIQFGADADIFDNAGYVLVNFSNNNQYPGQRPVPIRNFEGETRMLGLETFNHSGIIVMGGFDNGQSDPDKLDRSDDLFSDGWYDDVLSMPGTKFVGDEGEIRIDVDLVGSQSDCTTRNADGDLGAADCLMLVGGSTEGVTYVTLNEIVPDDRGRYNPDGIVLVDVTGGTSHQGDFVIGPNSANYSDEFGGVLDKGVFFYAIAYDEADQRQKLVGLPGGNAQQFPLLAQAGHSLWRTSTGTWFERQADLRGGFDEGMGGGVWLRASGEAADRDVTGSVSGGGQTFKFDNSFTQESFAVTAGLDLLSASADDSAWVFGLMLGYAHADVEYGASPNTGRFDGFTGGAYASFISGGFFVDGAVNANRLTMDDDIPALKLMPVGTILSTRIVSLGAQAEAGWRLPFANGLFVEPLAGFSYVRSKYDDMDVPAGDPVRPRIDVTYDDPTSLRASVGGRVGWDQDHGGIRTQLSMVGRVWNEFEGESTVTLVNQGTDVTLTDDFSGKFTELGLGASVYSPGGMVSGFINLGGKFADDYEAKTGSIGVRVNW